MTALATCSVCAAPYAPVSDDPSPAHPGCAPSDPTRFEAATRGPRTYTGRMRAIWWSVCRGCDQVIREGDVQALTVIDGRRVWACTACSARHSDETTPQSRPEATESAATLLARPRTSPERESANQSATPTAPRRAAA